MELKHTKFFKELALPATLEPNAFYFIKNNDIAEAYLTDDAGNITRIGNSDLINELSFKNIAVEAIASENTSGADYALADKLQFKPISVEGIELRLNKIEQNYNEDFTVDLNTGVITWLGFSGTALPLDLADDIRVTYKHNNEATI